MMDSTETLDLSKLPGNVPKPMTESFHYRAGRTESELRTTNMLKTFFLLFAFVLAANGQEQKDVLARDTLADRISLAQPEWQDSRTTLLSPLSFEILYGDRVDLLLQPQGVLGESRPWMLETKTDILSPWNLELKDEEKYSTWRSILGSVQVGGAAYLAYRYITKHGFR